MSLIVAIGSYRVRSSLELLAHWSAVSVTPVAALGLRDVLGWSNPDWARPAAGSLTLALIAASLVGRRLHRELDDAGLFCRWCVIENVEEVDV
jgi:hypothetical protein